MRRVLVVLLAAVCLLPLGAPVDAEAAAPAPIRELLSRLNGERAERGLRPVALRDDLSTIAGDHSIALSRERALRHNHDYFSDSTKRRLGARAVGENVAYAGSIAEVHAALMASPEHRAIILDPRWTVVGLGAIDDGSLWWVTQDFLQPR